MLLYSHATQSLKILLFLIFIAPINSKTFKPEPRGNIWLCCMGKDCDNDGADPDISEYNDGPTSDKTAGMGVEFETATIRFKSDGCTYEDTEVAKGKTVGGRQGLNWKLTADTTPVAAGDLSAEYILDGTKIKIGTGAAAAAASAVAHDITSWDPYKHMSKNELDIEESQCNPWYIGSPDAGGSAAKIGFSVQVTAPLPLEALHDLFSKAVADQPSELLPTIARFDRMVCVTKEFFQSAPNGIKAEVVTDDVLGFFSLIMSYAKHARTEEEDDSPKKLISIMPRTDFTNIFKQVKPAVPGKLYDIVKILGCYKNTPGGVELDSDFCSGTLESPQPNGKMDGQTFAVSTAMSSSDSCTVEEWMDSLDKGESPDRVTKLDQTMNSQVGGLKDALENVFDTSRAVPLFEFRRLKRTFATDMVDRVKKAEQTLINYHKEHATAPRKRGLRLSERVKQQSTPLSCSTIPSSTIAIPSATVVSQSPGVFFAVSLSNNSIPIEDANKEDNGSGLRPDVYKKLRALCPDQVHTCDGKTLVELDNITTVAGTKSFKETPTFAIKNSFYNNPSDRDQMLAAAIATWQQAASTSCRDVQYTQAVSEKCSTGNVQRDSWKHTSCDLRDDGIADSFMDIQLAFKVEGDDKAKPAADNFKCSYALASGLKTEAVKLALELAGKSIWQDQVFETICDG